MKSGSPLTDMENRTEENKSILVLPALRQRDQGTYSCKRGESTVSKHLIVRTGKLEIHVQCFGSLIIISCLRRAQS